MKFLIFLSDFIMPLMIFYIVAYGMLMKRPSMTISSRAPDG